jgi:hypothetical protein
VEDPSEPPVVVEGKTEYEFVLPKQSDKPNVRGKFESDESYEKRVELYDLIAKRKFAKTDEQKQLISGNITKARNELHDINNPEKFTNPLNQVAVEPKVEEDEMLTADKERLRELGGMTKDDFQEVLKQERQAGEVRNTLDKFVDRHSELKDDDVREVFFDFVESNYNWQNKSGKDLMTVLELARESMFKPSESIQDRVLKGANVQEKVNAMQFPGGTIAKTALSPDMQKSIDELTATGMSEQKALELLSD